MQNATNDAFSHKTFLSSDKLRRTEADQDMDCLCEPFQKEKKKDDLLEMNHVLNQTKCHIFQACVLARQAPLPRANDTYF